jgi:hypothetical protein
VIHIQWAGQTLEPLIYCLQGVASAAGCWLHAAAFSLTARRTVRQADDGSSASA